MLSIIINIVLSVAIIFLIYYVVYLIRTLLFHSENLSELKDNLNLFREHLESIYELEVFYGDETLESLLQHSKEISTYIEKYNEIYSLAEEEIGEEFENEEEDPEDEREE
tara:strand:+ start:830 stop:1159 length:330 start_codon:yes stop_codon:yes gene_type:complete